MIFWLLTGLAFYLTGGLWAFVTALGLIIFFPRIAWASYAFVAFPIWTLFFSTWMFVLGWAFNFCSFSLDSWSTCFWITSVPVGLFLMVTGRAAITELSA